MYGMTTTADGEWFPVPLHQSCGVIVVTRGSSNLSLLHIPLWDIAADPVCPGERCHSDGCLTAVPLEVYTGVIACSVGDKCH